MNNKSIELNLGGRWTFQVVKVFVDDVERFGVTLGSSSFGAIHIVSQATWAEASAAMNKFKEEFETAFEALVQASTLTPIGVHEEA